MLFEDKIVVVTGGGSGIGAALVKAFDAEGAILAIVDLRGSNEILLELSRSSTTNNSPSSKQKKHLAFTCDVTNQEQVHDMIRHIKQRYGRIDIYCSNAGIIYPPPPPKPKPSSNDNSSGNDSSFINDFVSKYTNEQWTNIWQVNVQSHVICARELIPDWELGIGDGVFVVTASAAGLLTMIGDASYGVTKAAAISFAEHVAISHGKHVQVHCLCPQAVDTPFTSGVAVDTNSAMTDGVVSAEFVASCCLEAISTTSSSSSKNDGFWILPHPQVQEYVKRKAVHHGRWLKGMQSLRNKLMEGGDAAAPSSKL